MNEQQLPPLPDTGLAEIHNPNTNERDLSEAGVAYYGSNWIEVRKLYTGSQMHAYARAALAAQGAPAQAQQADLSEALRSYAFECGRETELPGEVVERDLLALIASPAQIAQDVAPMFDKAVDLVQSLDYHWTGNCWLKNAPAPAKAQQTARTELPEGLTAVLHEALVALSFCGKSSQSRALNAQAIRRIKALMGQS